MTNASNDARAIVGHYTTKLRATLGKANATSFFLDTVLVESRLSRSVPPNPRTLDFRTHCTDHSRYHLPVECVREDPQQYGDARRAFPVYDVLRRRCDFT